MNSARALVLIFVSIDERSASDLRLRDLRTNNITIAAATTTTVPAVAPATTVAAELSPASDLFRSAGDVESVVVATLVAVDNSVLVLPCLCGSMLTLGWQHPEGKQAASLSTMSFCDANHLPAGVLEWKPYGASS